MLEKYNDVLDVNDMREILKIGQNTAYHLLRTGTIRSIKIGRNIRIPQIALIEYLTETSTLKTNCTDLSTSSGKNI